MKLLPYTYLTVCTFFSFSLMAQVDNQIQYQAALDSDSYSQLIQETFPADNALEISDIKLNGILGDEATIGSFSNAGLTLGFESGLVLTNSALTDFFGSNTATGIGRELNTAGDANLSLFNTVYNQNMGTIPTFDASSIQFQFTPSSNELSLEYVFASEEYCDFAESLFTDKVGIFLAGPGIQGPFTINGEPAINLAEFTSASGDLLNVDPRTINHLVNTNLYIDNNTPITANSQLCEAIDITNNPFTELSQFDGWTVPMTASYNNLQIGEEYTIEIVIADGTDQLFGSAIFLNEGSFTTNGFASDPPVADAGEIAITCILPDSFTLGGPATSCGPEFTYQWTIQNGIVVSTEKNPIVTQIGPYTLTVTNENTDEQSSSFITLTDGRDVPLLDLTKSDDFDCNTESILIEAFTDVPLSEASFAWTATDGGHILSDTSSASIMVDAIGRYEVRVKNLVNTCSITRGISVEDINEDLLTGGFISPIASCGESSLIIDPCTINPNTSTMPCTGFWDQQPGLSIDAFPLAVIDSSGVYTFNFTSDINGCQVPTRLLYVDVQITDPLLVDLIINTNNQIEAIVTGGTANYTYDWNVGATTPTIENPINGTEYILTVRDANGCELTESFTYMSTAVFSPHAKEISVSPNPTDGLLHLDLDEQSIRQVTQLQIFDVKGVAMSLDKELISGSRITLDLRNLQAGIYILHAVIEGDLFYQKVVVQ